MKHCCLDCNKQFETAQGLRRHIMRKMLLYFLKEGGYIYSTKLLEGG